MFNKSNLPKSPYRPNFLRSIISFACSAVLMLFVAVGSVTAAADVNVDREVDFVKIDSTKVYKTVEQMPEVIGGVKAIYKEIKYPKRAIKAGVEGRVFLQFVVDEKGDVQDPKVLRGIGTGCDKAAIAALKKVKFKPGVHKGEKVKVQYSLPITFKIER